MNANLGGLLQELFGNSDIIGGNDPAIPGIGVLLMILCFLIITSVISIAVSVISYLLYALSTYRLAKKLDVQKAWLAWIPLAQYFTLGKVAEQCDVRRGKSTKPWGKIMLFVALGAMVACAVLGGIGGFLNSLLPPLGIPVTMLSSLVSWAPLVIMCICCWKIYREFFPETVNTVLFVISIVFSVQTIVNLVASFRQPNPVEDTVIENVTFSTVE